MEDKKSSSGGFQSLGLSKESLKGLGRLGYKVPTPVQRKTLPLVLAGMDVVCMARTGSGKTCAFLLPLLERLKEHAKNSGVRGLVLSPTRELAMQTYKFAKDMGKFSDLRIVAIVGGDPMEAQFEALSTKPDIIIATPGRLMHMLKEISTLTLKFVRYLVFDEADRLFEMGFAEQLNEIIKECPIERQTLLFSATMPKMLIQFTRAGLKDPQLVRLDSDFKLSDELRVGFLSVRPNEKVAALLYLVRHVLPKNQLTIVFTATRHHSEFLHRLFQIIGEKSTLIYGTMDQDARAANLKLFRNGEVSYLLVTDLAARGIDVPLLNNVINFHFPPSPKLFLHRCGRAARQGRIGYAISLVDGEELGFTVDVHTLLGKPVSTGFIERGSAENNACYDLNTMTPSDVHTGLIPQDCIDEENEYLKKVLVDDDHLLNAFNVSENGMKQYRRTRTEASKDGVKAAKVLVKSRTIRHIHPLIKGCDPKSCTDFIVEKADFIRQLQTFRPSQTVFETGIGTSVNRATKGVKDSVGAHAMKALRKEVESALERNKVKASIYDSVLKGGEESEEIIGFDDEEPAFLFDEYAEGEEDLEVTREEGDHDEDSPLHRRDDEGSVVESIADKVRLSRAARKKMKKLHLPIFTRRPAAPSDSGVELTMSEPVLREGGSFQDPRFYMTYGTEDEKAVFSEASMQPKSNLRDRETQGANMLEYALLDVAPDAAADLNAKRRIMRWDAKKRKFVKQSLEEMAQSGKGSKRIRTESGTVVRGSSAPAGELYAKWKKKTRREISVSGEDEGPRPRAAVNNGVRSELRGADEIRRMKRSKDDVKLKNMRRDKRSQIEGKLRKQKKATRENTILANRPGNRKMKIILRT